MRTPTLLLITLLLPVGMPVAWGLDCGCSGCLRQAVPPADDERHKAGPALEAVIVDPPATIDTLVNIQIVRVADDDGSNPAPLFGNDTQQAIIFDLVDDIWAQAGIDVVVTIRPGTWDNTFVNRGDGGERPSSDLFDIVDAADAEGISSDDPLTLNVFMVRVVPAFEQLGGNFANGLAFRPGNGIAMWAGPNLPGFSGGRDALASVLAHEIGHNLGLPHVDTAENLMEPGSDAGAPGGDPDGERLVSGQVSSSRSSPFARTITYLRDVVITLRDGAAAPISGQEVDFDNPVGGSTMVDTDVDGEATASGLTGLVRTTITFLPGGGG